MAKVLLVEDDTSLSEIVMKSLTDEHFLVEHSNDGFDAMQRLNNFSYDLMILDWELPCMSGIEICRKYRAMGGRARILMLTGKNRIDDKEQGFVNGVDDYLTKPFELRELKLRLHALLRRPAGLVEDVLEHSGFSVDVRAHEASKDGIDLKLSPKEFGLLEFLLRNRGQVVNADQLLRSIWVADEAVGLETVRTHIKNLRGKIDDKTRDRSYIKTVFGVGYMFDSD